MDNIKRFIKSDNFDRYSLAYFVGYTIASMFAQTWGMFFVGALGIVVFLLLLSTHEKEGQE